MSTIILQQITDKIIRCCYHPDGVRKMSFTLVNPEIQSHIENPESVCADPAEHAAIELHTSCLHAEANEKTGAVCFSTVEGETLLQEARKEFINIPVSRYVIDGEKPVIERVATVDGERNFVKNLKAVEDRTALRGRIHYNFQNKETIHGLGQGEDGIYNYRSHTQYLYQHNMRIPMPVFVSDRHYGVFFDSGCLMTFNDTESGSYMYFDAVEQVEYYFVYGETLDEIVAGFRFLTGKAVMLPRWAYGYIQSKEHYHTATELADTARHYRDLGVPIDCVVQDWNTWVPGQWGQKTMDPERYGDLELQMKALKDMHVHTMVSIWPNMNTGTPDHTEMMETGHLLTDFTTYDAFSEKGREIYFRQAKEGLMDRGFDSWWCDSTEPFSGPDWGGALKREPWERFQMVGGEHVRFLPEEKANIYSLMHARGMYENQRKTVENKRVLNLTRSGYAGSQKFGAVLWSGDITASWHVMRKQITEGLNMGLSGYPYWTLDIGGFFTVGEKWQKRGCGCNTDPSEKWFWKGTYDEGVRDPAYCELYVRWLQFGVFLPMFRSHGTDTPREIWNFGAKGTPFYDAIEKYIRLRYQLLPYIYSEAAGVCLRNGTMMRSLLFDFPEDKIAAELSNEYMFGSAFLVCPVTEPMYYESEGWKITEKTKKIRDVYLPSGTDWFNFNSMAREHGGRTISVDAPLDTMPLFVKCGSIVPMRKNLTYANEENGSPLEIHIFSGTDASFLYYEDAGDGYGYESGEFAETCFLWDEKNRYLCVDERKGAFEGMLSERELEVYLDEKYELSFRYTGKRSGFILP